MLIRIGFPRMAYFPTQEIDVSRQSLSEDQLLGYLDSVQDAFPPLSFRVRSGDRGMQRDSGLDGIAEAAWGDQRFLFAVEAKRQSTPKAIQQSASKVEEAARRLGLEPLLLTPYLSETQLRYLESRQVSGLDLCGNGVVIVPGKLLVFRTGNANRFPNSQPIRNVYRGTSSLVARCFLLRSEYASAQELLEEIKARGGEVTLPTVSKVCSTLEEDLMIARERQGRATRLRLLQPDKLLDQLAAEWEPISPRRVFVGKWIGTSKAWRDALTEWSKKPNNRVLATGETSTNAYATMAREPVDRFYCTQVGDLVRSLGELLQETKRFPNVELIETDEPAAYFDPRSDLTASPLQTYLELIRGHNPMLGDKRHRETAEQVRERILTELQQARGTA